MWGYIPSTICLMEKLFNDLKSSKGTEEARWGDQEVCHQPFYSRFPLEMLWSTTPQSMGFIDIHLEGACWGNLLLLTPTQAHEIYSLGISTTLSCLFLAIHFQNVKLKSILCGISINGQSCF